MNGEQNVKEVEYVYYTQEEWNAYITVVEEREWRNRCIDAIFAEEEKSNTSVFVKLRSKQSEKK